MKRKKTRAGQRGGEDAHEDNNDDNGDDDPSDSEEEDDDDDNDDQGDFMKEGKVPMTPELFQKARAWLAQWGTIEEFLGLCF